MARKRNAPRYRHIRAHYQKGLFNPSTKREKAQIAIGAAAFSGLLPFLLMVLAAWMLGDI